jgi:hypothetical protein
VLDENRSRHRARLGVVKGGGARCHALGLTAPCFLPRLQELAHERLLSEDQFGATLSGEFRLIEVQASRPELGVLFTSPLAAGLSLAAAWLLWRRRRQEPLASVLRLAKRARTAMRGLAEFAALDARVDELVARAKALELARREGVRKLKQADVDQQLLPTGMEVSETALVRGEIDLAGRELMQVASALRAILLSTRRGRGLVLGRGRIKEAIATELSILDEASTEARKLME